MTEVIPGIYQLQLPLPKIFLEHINTYLVKGDNEYLLIDTGWDMKEATDSLKKQLDEIGVDFKDISQIVITHVHPDHYGLAGRLKQLSQAKLAMHLIERDFIESRYIDMDNLLQQMQRWLHINGVPSDELPELQTASIGMRKFVVPVLPDVILRGGETISIGSFNFKVLWTPGHSPGHICLYEPSQEILISGDHILPTITPNIGLHPQSSSNPLDDYLNSLKALKQLDVNLILSAHEDPFTGLQRRIEELIWHHEQRKSRILETMKAKSKTAYQISAEISWLTDIYASGVKWENLSSLDKRIAILETLAHLEHLEEQGVARRRTDNGRVLFSLS